MEHLKKSSDSSPVASTHNSSIVGCEESPICLGLDLDSFKSFPCGQKSTHHCPKSCLDFHSESDQRRPFTKFRYAASRCPKNCAKKNCSLANNIIEEKYHPSLYKKKYCRKLLVSGQCDYGDSCPFAHSDSDLRIKPLHLLPIDADFMLFSFKSQFCPYSWQRHNAYTCVYAHNWQDFKRPFFADQVPQMCPAWKDSTRVEEYGQNCPEGFGCKFCHGWKEFDFHPSNYKADRCAKPDHQQLSLSKAKPSLTQKKADQMIAKQTCCLRHSDETPFSYSSEQFHAARRQLHHQSFTTQEFLLEVSSLRLKKADSSPNPSKVPKVIVNFLTIEQEEPQKPRVFSASSNPYASSLSKFSQSYGF